MLLASAAIGALMVGGAADAADLPASAPVYKATPMAPAFSWAGFYLGIEGGGAWGKSRQRSDVGDIAPGFNLNGGLVGGTYGTNWQFGSWVLGMESDISWSNLKGSANEGLTPANTATTKQTWVGFDRGRVGYAWGQWMVFAAGGLAESTIEADSVGSLGSISQSKYRLGWTGGGGVEWAFARHGLPKSNTSTQISVATRPTLTQFPPDSQTAPAASRSTKTSCGSGSTITMTCRACSPVHS